mmetsp:Transcript_10871/g.19779  ORF Transcript_10871/g.19779 Transcript_10871/m.19779 type:complete len:86 (-) Transcript_10871:470-727(-)
MQGSIGLKDVSLELLLGRLGPERGDNVASECSKEENVVSTAVPGVVGDRIMGVVGCSCLEGVLSIENAEHVPEPSIRGLTPRGEI